MKIPEMSIESLNESQISRWSQEVLKAILRRLPRNRDSGIASTKVLSTKMAVIVGSFVSEAQKCPSGEVPLAFVPVTTHC